MAERTTVADRFWAKVDRQPNGCWHWMGERGRNGYGVARTAGAYFAHRLAYELLVGPIPEGLVIDHLCRVRHCVNPAHLEPVTSGENTLRGETVAAANARKTHCDRGHEFTPENTYWKRDRAGQPRWRECKACRYIDYLKRHGRIAS